MKASVYSEMKAHPTRSAAGDAGSNATSAAVRYLTPSSPAVGGSCCWVGPLSTGLEESGIALPFGIGGAAADNGPAIEFAITALRVVHTTAA